MTIKEKSLSRPSWSMHVNTPEAVGLNFVGQCILYLADIIWNIAVEYFRKEDRLKEF